MRTRPPADDDADEGGPAAATVEDTSGRSVYGRSGLPIGTARSAGRPDAGCITQPSGDPLACRHQQCPGRGRGGGDDDDRVDDTTTGVDPRYRAARRAALLRPARIHAAGGPPHPCTRARVAVHVLRDDGAHRRRARRVGRPVHGRRDLCRLRPGGGRRRTCRRGRGRHAIGRQWAERHARQPWTSRPRVGPRPARRRGARGNGSLRSARAAGLRRRRGQRGPPLLHCGRGGSDRVLRGAAGARGHRRCRPPDGHRPQGRRPSCGRGDPRRRRAGTARTFIVGRHGPPRLCDRSPGKPLPMRTSPPVPTRSGAPS